MEAIIVMCIDPFYLLKSVLSAHPENPYTTDEPKVQQRECCIYSHYFPLREIFVFSHYLKTWGDTKVQVKDPYELK